jgi:hypothetical protein
MEKGHGKDLILTLWSAFLTLYRRCQLPFTLTPPLLESLDLLHVWDGVGTMD